MSNLYSEVLFFFSTFSLYTSMGSGVAMRDPVQLLRKSIYVCIPCFKSVSPRVCMAKVPFLASFGPDMNIEMDMIIYMHLKHSPDYIDSKYIWVRGLTP